MSEAVTQPAPNHIPSAEELGFDPGSREKYAAERAKRLRAESNGQYREITGQFEHYNATLTLNRTSRATRCTKNLTS